MPPRLAAPKNASMAGAAVVRISVKALNPSVVSAISSRIPARIEANSPMLPPRVLNPASLPAALCANCVREAPPVFAKSAS